MSTRLLNYRRLEIKDAMISFRFDPQKKLIDSLREELAMSIYDKTYSEKDIKILVSMPDGFVPIANFIRTNIAGHVVCLGFPHGKRAKFSDLLRWERDTMMKEDQSFDGAHQFADRWRDICNQTEDYNKEMNRTAHMILVKLRGYGTLETLIKEWPEAEFFVKSTSKEKTEVKLPAVKTEVINNILGLPVPQPGINNDLEA